MTNSPEASLSPALEPSLPMSPKRFAAIVVVCLAGIAVLSALGVWQVERLFWKQGIIATIDARIHAAPVPLSEIAALVNQGGEVDYRPVRLTGAFDHSGERYFLATLDGAAGWHVFTPFLVSGTSEVVFVNRGFVPYDRKDPATRTAGNTTGEVTIEGLARDAPKAKPNSFVPDNDPTRNAFFWRNIPDLATGLSLPPNAKLLPFLVDAGPGAAPGGYPIGGVTVVEVPNSHLEYAVTWFSLALALAVILVVFLVRAAKVRSARRAG